MSEDWITSQEARTRLQRTERQLRRYVELGQLRSRRRGRRVEYQRQDIEQIAQELPMEPQDLAPEVQLIPPSDLLEYIRDLQRQIEEYAVREGYLRSQLEIRPQLQDTQALQTELAQVNTERDTLQTRYRRARLLVAGLLVALLTVVVFLVIAVVAGWTVTVRIGQ